MVLEVCAANCKSSFLQSIEVGVEAASKRVHGNLSCWSDFRTSESVIMTNRHFVRTLTAFYAFLSVAALKVTINGKDAGMSRCISDIHQPIKLPVWPVWSGVVAQCFDWIKAPQISESIVSSVGGRVVPITLSNLDVSPFLLLAHHCHSFTPLDPIRSALHYSYMQLCHQCLQWKTLHLYSLSLRVPQRSYKARPP